MASDYQTHLKTKTITLLTDLKLTSGETSGTLKAEHGLTNPIGIVGYTFGGTPYFTISKILINGDVVEFYLCNNSNYTGTATYLTCEVLYAD